ncbi:MAG: argininosuccinate lyase [Archaeoglobaceae archaeon]
MSEKKDKEKEKGKDKSGDQEKKGVVRSRLDKDMDEMALFYSSSLEHDSNIFFYVIMVDMAHTLNLLAAGHLEWSEAKNILNAIQEIKEEGYSTFNSYEDIHEAVEAKLTETTDDGRKIQTAKSRNDEIATCLRLFARDRLLMLMDSLLAVRISVLELAKEYIDIVMPGYTHLQPAQPTRLSHHLIAYHDMLARDFERAVEAMDRVNLCPLGSAAFASTSFETDRGNVADLLGFDDVVDNSADAVSSRDFLIESVYAATSSMLSMSRMAEEIILWSSEFDYIELPDEFASSSSIMPQKKNPDIAELLRAKAGRLNGNLTALISMYRAMPFNYNRDFQEMNPLLYQSVETAIASANLMAKMLKGIQFKREIMTQKVGEKFISATELANLMVKKAEIPFRSAHEIVGRLALEGNYHPSIEDVDQKALEIVDKRISDFVSREELNRSLDPQYVVENMGSGGPARSEVERMIKDRDEQYSHDESEMYQLIDKISARLERLHDEVRRVVG